MTKFLTTLVFAAFALVSNAQAASHAGAAPMAKASEAKKDAKPAAKAEAKPAAKAASAAASAAKK